MMAPSLSLGQQCMQIKWPQIRSSDSTSRYFSFFIAALIHPMTVPHITTSRVFCKIDTELNLWMEMRQVYKEFWPAASLLRKTQIAPFQRFKLYRRNILATYFWGTLQKLGFETNAVSQESKFPNNSKKETFSQNTVWIENKSPKIWPIWPSSISISGQVWHEWI